LALVALVLGVFVVRPLLMPTRSQDIAGLANDRLAENLSTELPVLSGTIEPDDTGSGLPALAEPAIQADHLNTEDAVARLKSLIEGRRSETVEVLRSWLDDPKPEDAR
jgi:flagellar M-ring protein FliF